MGDILARQLKTLDAIMDAEAADLEGIPEIGPRTAEGIVDYFAQSANREMISDLLASGVTVIDDGEPNDQSLSGKRFVLTGTLSAMTRSEASQAIRDRGGEVSSAVSSKTDYVVVGENPGSKAAKAQQLGVSILNEQEFVSLLGGKI